MEGETRKGARIRRKLEAIGRQISKETCPNCGEQKVYYHAWKEPICPICGADLRDIKGMGKVISDIKKGGKNDED